jgi:hypothetical protein
MSKYSPNKVSIALTITFLVLLGTSIVADKMGIGGAQGFGSGQIVLLATSLFTVVVGGGWMLVDLVGSRSTSSSSTFPNSRFQRSAVKAAGLSALGTGAIVLVEVAPMGCITRYVSLASIGICTDGTTVSGAGGRYPSELCGLIRL